jgi:aminoglycoside phosphotransferase family enzyme/predicted kinase
VSVSASQSVGFAETHCAVVFLVGDRAYKLKKPVDLGFLDFSTREARERVCHREVELNRRLSPDVYLGVADVLDPDGQVCDHLVVMRRMPDQRRLASLLDQGYQCGDCLRAIARKVAGLHAAAPTSAERPEIGEVATRDAVAGNWADNFDMLHGFMDNVLVADEFARVQRLATRYLAGRGLLFEQRIADGKVRDGHGDLLAEDIFCLDDGPRILDCLEFADRYRYGDVLLDAAFLAMDLERLGHPDAATRFLGWYAEFSGEHHPATLAHHYIAYRAHVRAKVACLRHAQTGDAAATEEARRLHRLVLDHLRAGRVTLALVGGLPGTGKSTVAAGLADGYGWALLRSDELRKDLAGLGHTADAHAEVGEGLYRLDQVARVYRELLARARSLLEQGVPVVLDATWTSAADRRAAAELAWATRSDLVQLHCETPLDVARARVAARPPGTDVSDATSDVVDAMAAHADPWPQATTVQTGRAIDQVLTHARQAVETQLEHLESAPASDSRGA